MNTQEESVFTHAIQLLLAAAIGAWAWVVKTAATQHLAIQSRLEEKVDGLLERVAKLEGRLFHHEHKNDEG